MGFACKSSWLGYASTPHICGADIPALGAGPRGTSSPKTDPVECVPHALNNLAKSLDELTMQAQNEL